MASQGTDDLPDDLVDAGGENRVRVGFQRDDDGDDDVPVFLARSAAHDAADRLDDVDTAAPGIEVHDRVQVGHVDALREAPRVGEDVALVVGGLLRQPVELVAPGGGVHTAVHMVDLHMNLMVRGNHRLVLVGVLEVARVVVDDRAELRAQRLGVLDARGERDRVVQDALGIVRRSLGGVFAARDKLADTLGMTPIEQGLPATHKLGRVGQRHLLVFAVLLLHDRSHHVLGDLHDHDLVIREQSQGDGLAETQPVGDAPVDLLVVHAGDLDGAFLGLVLRALAEDAGRGRHVQALVAVDEVGVVDLLERGLPVHHARGAVRLVADCQVELR